MEVDTGGLIRLAALCVTAVGVAVGVLTYILNVRRQIRRSTLEACERFILDDKANKAMNRVAAAIETGSFPDDSDPPSPESLRSDVSYLINYLETLCQGVDSGFYDKKIAHEYLYVHARMLGIYFLDPKSNDLVSERWANLPLPYLRKLFLVD